MPLGEGTRSAPLEKAVVGRVPGPGAFNVVKMRLPGWISPGLKAAAKSR